MSNETIYHIIYQTRNSVNGKIYIGAHTTSNLDDGYIGSGKILKRAIDKHGIENFTREILYIFDNKEEMYQKEKELVNEEFLERDDVYNIKLGGRGGFDHIDYTDPNEIERRRHLIANINKMCDEKYGKNWRSFLVSKECMVQNGNNNVVYKRGIFAEEHKLKGTEAAKTTQAKDKRKQTYKNIKHQLGEKNSQYGTMWITNGVSNKKIKKNQEIESGWFKGRV